MDKVKQICILENFISDKIFTDNKSKCHFDYEYIQGNEHKPATLFTQKSGWKLTLVTYNSNHEECFIAFISSVQNEKGGCLVEAKEYLLKKDNFILTYTIKWFKKGESKVHSSYFNGKDIIEVIDKFSRGKEMFKYVIKSIELMPES